MSSNEANVTFAKLHFSVWPLNVFMGKICLYPVRTIKQNQRGTNNCQCKPSHVQLVFQLLQVLATSKSTELTKDRLRSKPVKNN